MDCPTFSELNSYIKVALTASQEGGKILKKYWQKVSSIQDKDVPGNLVTEADKESEKIIVQIIKKNFPEHSILAEESGLEQLGQSDFLWIIDPLDGTVNYAHNHPMFAISIALAFKGEIVLGVIFNPIYEQLFTAVKGKGATLNGEKISVSSIASLDKSLLATGFAYDRRTVAETNYAEFCYLTHLSHGVRRCGAASLDLAFVAAGRLDGYWERGLKPWDMAAGLLLVREAGGLVSDYNETPIKLESGRILATNGKIHHALSQAIQSSKEQIRKLAVFT